MVIIILFDKFNPNVVTEFPKEFADIKKVFDVTYKGNTPLFAKAAIMIQEIKLLNTSMALKRMCCFRMYKFFQQKIEKNLQITI